MDNNPENHKPIKLGSKVKILLADNKEQIFVIASTKEADPGKGIISNECPMGRAILGAKEGDLVSYQVGDNLLTVQVVEILSC